MFKPRDEAEWFKRTPRAYNSNKPRQGYSLSGLYYDLCCIMQQAVILCNTDPFGIMFSMALTKYGSGHAYDQLIFYSSNLV